MEPITPDIKDLAEKLLTREASCGTNSEAGLSVVVRVCEKLQRPLALFAGAEGFRTLLVRALALARTHEPVLSVLRVNTSGSLEYLSEADSNTDSDTVARAGYCIVEQLLSLLTVFIGKSLTLRLVRGAFPNLNDDADPHIFRTRATV
jgi:hypothetical protein